MSLLTLIQGACDRIGIVRPTSVIGSTDQQVLRLLGYAQQEGKDLAQKYDWQVLRAEQTFISVAQASQTGAVPSNFDHFVNETFFNRSKKRPVFGPMSPQEWQFAQSVVSTVIVESFIVRSDAILLTPTPPAGDSYAYEYIKNTWCQSSGGTAQTAWAADTDTGILSEELMTLGVVWRFKAGRGYSYDEEFRSYEIMCAERFARDGGRRTLNAGYRPDARRPRAPFIQDGSWSL